MLHSVIVRAALFGDQLGSALWREANHEKEGAMMEGVALFHYDFSLSQLNGNGIEVISATDKENPGTCSVLYTESMPTEEYTRVRKSYVF